MARVLVSDALSDAGLEVLRRARDAEVDYQPGIDEAQLADAIVDAEALIIRSGSRVTARVLEAADRLRVIGRAGVGVENVDVEAASRRGVVIMNTPAGNAASIAEHALALLFALCRHIPEATQTTRGGGWERQRFLGVELAGKTLGVLGLGHVGRILAERARGLGMQVVASDPMISPDQAAHLGVVLRSLEEVLTAADFLSVQVPLTPETRHLLDEAAFARMKPGAMVVNVARGGIVDEEALLRAVDSGHLAGAALDVFETEPLPADDPLRKDPRIVVTPHLAASTAEAQRRVAIEIAQQVVDYLERGIVRHPINVPEVAPAAAHVLRPYLELGRRLGSLLAQIAPDLGRELRVTCTGEAGELGLSPITHAALAGYLERRLRAPVSPISAPIEAGSHGLSVVEVREEATHGHLSSIRLTSAGEAGIHTATGTLSIAGEPRLVGLDGYEIDAFLSGCMLVIRNADRPGVIGAVGTILGMRNINVSRMQVGLDEMTGEAVALWNVDAPVTPKALDEIRALENIHSVLAVEL